MTQDDPIIKKHLAAALELASIGKAPPHRKAKRETLQTHLKKAIELSSVTHPLDAQPIRTIHHLSCTGGTLFAKCIASMANVLLLNEVDLHSTMQPSSQGKPGFTPTDMISLLRQADRNMSPDLVTKIFLNDLAILLTEQGKLGRDIVLRDHSHSHYLTGSEVPDRPTLLETINQEFSTLSILTVRDPIDSYLSVLNHYWHHHFSPSTFEEYCKRYIQFLDDYAGLNIIKYEAFVQNPRQCMWDICEMLNLTYFDGFEDVYGCFRFSGDSGRRNEQEMIVQERRELPAGFAEEVKGTPSYAILRRKLDYPDFQLNQ